MLHIGAPFYGATKKPIFVEKRNIRPARSSQQAMWAFLFLCMLSLLMLFRLHRITLTVADVELTSNNSPEYDEDSQTLEMPVIGIPTVPNPFYNQTETSLLFPSLVKWLEMAGAKVVPLLLSHDLSNLDSILPNLNAVVFQGGADSTYTEPYRRFHHRILEHADWRHKIGDPLPILGICLGLETLIAYDGYKLDNCNDNNFWRELSFSDNPSRIVPESAFGQAYKQVATDFQVSKFSHHICAHVDDFISTVGDRYEIVATAKDQNDVEFVAMFESKAGLPPRYAFQFHPEDVNFFLMEGEMMPIHTIQASSYLATFYVEEARKRQTTMTLLEWSMFGVDLYSPPYVFPLEGYYEI